MLDTSPQCEISLSFSNNLLQTFLIDFFEKENIELKQTKIAIPSFDIISNVIHIEYQHHSYYLIVQNKSDFIDNIIDSPTLIDILNALTLITSCQNIYLLLFQVQFDSEESLKEPFIYFITQELGIKCLEVVNTKEVTEFLLNFLKSLSSKENKANITYFDSKPVQSTHLCDLEGIANKIWVKHLMCINGVSEMKAIAIVKDFSNIKSLYDIYLSDQYLQREKEYLLECIEVVNKAKNKNQKIGKALSSKIYNYFTSNNPDLII